ncbi:MAG: VWA domain-containing protein [Deltaproteobacteria bacterium]|nr:VWA domain-containing protein [Deltaproteobacteria bacterium]
MRKRAARHHVLLLLGLLGFGLGFGCARSTLEKWPPREDTHRDDKLEIDGSLCTREPESLIFPLRVLFIVDGSESMRITDPVDPVTLQTGREMAVEATWQDLLDQGIEGVRIGIMRFSAQAQSYTPVDYDGDTVPDSYFTVDPLQLTSATSQLQDTDRTTNYLNALSEAYFELRTEMLQGDIESLPLSKYVVIFVSDGIPDIDDQESRENSSENILESVLQLRRLAELFHVGDFSFHTAYLSAGQGPALDQPAQQLLRQMAEVGGGSYRSFPNGEEINFLHIDLSIIRRVFTLRTLAVINEMALLDQHQKPDIEMPRFDSLAYVDLDGSGEMDCGEPLVDSDGDGLADHVELRIGSDPFLADTDDDGLSDRVEWDFRMSGRDPLDPDDSKCFVPEPCRDCGADGSCPESPGYPGPDAGEAPWSCGADGLCPADPGYPGPDAGENPGSCGVDGLCPPDPGYPGPDSGEGDGICDCLRDGDRDGVCDCVGDPDQVCMDAAGHDCLDTDLDGWCDCPDLDVDGRCDWEDRDGDRLGDCEEIFFGSASNGTDSDADGLPDTLEVRFRTSPVEADEVGDLDFDLTPNGVEVETATDPLCDDSAFRSEAAYRYRIEELGLQGASTCYDFQVSNITLVPTLQNPAADFPGNGWNRVLVYAGEVAFDDPETFAAYRVACVEASYVADGDYKNPPSGRMTVGGADPAEDLLTNPEAWRGKFVDVRDFDPDLHCLRP